MATILQQGTTGDGYDVRVLVTERAHTLHFVTQPSDTELAVVLANLEKRLLDEIVQETINEQEEGNVFLFDE